MVAQILVVFEIWRFLRVIFFQKVRKLKFNFISSKFEFPHCLVWGCQSGLKVSGVANLAFNCDYSRLCSFPDMTLCCFFKKISENFNFFSSIFEVPNHL